MLHNLQEFHKSRLESRAVKIMPAKDLTKTFNPRSEVWCKQIRSYCLYSIKKNLTVLIVIHLTGEIEPMDGSKSIVASHAD